MRNAYVHYVAYVLYAVCVCVFRMSQAMSAVLKRVKHSDPNVQLHALTVRCCTCVGS